MTALPFRCPATRRDGTPCARTEPHGRDDLHAGNGLTWGARNEPEPFIAAWVARALAHQLPFRDTTDLVLR